MFNETRHQIHVSSVKQDPTLDTVHVPVQGAGVIDKVQESPEGVAVHVLDVQGAIVVTGQQTLELSFEEWTGNGKDQSVG